MSGCHIPDVIKISETSREFRNGFMFAIKSVADMGKGNHTYTQFLKILNDIIVLNEKGVFFPNEN